MGRPRKWASDAERKAAARKLDSDIVEAESARDLYVRACVEAAERDAQSRAESRTIARGLNKDLQEIDIEARVERAKAYAAWRWDAHLAGEVASL